MNKRYCKDYENIENYDKALADNFKGWHCHHRLETHTFLKISFTGNCYIIIVKQNK